MCSDSVASLMITKVAQLISNINLLLVYVRSSGIILFDVSSPVGGWWAVRVAAEAIVMLTTLSASFYCYSAPTARYSMGTYYATS